MASLGRVKVVFEAVFKNERAVKRLIRAKKLTRTLRRKFPGVPEVEKLEELLEKVGRSVRVAHNDELPE